jgi:hypothetical protein
MPTWEAFIIKLVYQHIMLSFLVSLIWEIGPLNFTSLEIFMDHHNKTFPKKTTRVLMGNHVTPLGQLQIPWIIPIDHNINLDIYEQNIFHVAKLRWYPKAMHTFK